MSRLPEFALLPLDNGDYALFCRVAVGGDNWFLVQPHVLPSVACEELRGKLIPLDPEGESAGVGSVDPELLVAMFRAELGMEEGVDDE